jgi:hypothetical protein
VGRVQGSTVTHGRDMAPFDKNAACAVNFDRFLPTAGEWIFAIAQCLAEKEVLLFHMAIIDCSCGGNNRVRNAFHAIVSPLSHPYCLI